MFFTLPEKIIRKKITSPKEGIYGISFENLSLFFQKALIENPLIEEYCDDDQFVLIFFYLLNLEDYKKYRFKKIIYNPYKDIISDFKTFEKDIQLIDWKCALCQNKIQSILGEFDIKNLLCANCKESYKNTKYVDVRIVENSLQFKNHCKKFLLKQQKELLKYIFKFNKQRKIKK